jgi:Cof subfamily protein (haloacid dehalogenase superfamily)
MRDDSDRVNLPDFSQPPDAVALDIDGTLLDSQSHLSARNSAAIEKCLTAGLPVIIATSRPMRAVRRLLGTYIANTCSLVMQNGVIGLGRPPLSGNIKEVIPPKIARELVAGVLKMEPGIRITAELEGESFGTNHPRGAASLWETNSATPEMQLTLEQVMKSTPGKFALGGLDRDISHIATMIRQRFGDTLIVVEEATRTFLNVTLITATKSNTLRRLLQSKNILLANTLAIGDDLPDHDMLSACGFAVAMGNAVPEIKGICKYQTLSNNEDGVAVVLEKILNSNSKQYLKPKK